MNSRDRIKTIISGEKADRTGFWLGQPHAHTVPILYDYFGVKSDEELRLKLQDDFRWICPQFFPDTYREPSGRSIFDAGEASSGRPFFQDSKDAADVDKFPWPDVKYLDFSNVIETLKNSGPYYRASGMWTCFYHDVMGLFGMESYMMNMYDNPELVHSVTDKVCSFYYDANKVFFEQAGDLADAFFFGNDFGTQLDLICGLPQFDEYIMPWFIKFTNLAHDYGYQVILHSCGAVSRTISRFIEAKVDCLHPIQALAKDMDADGLAKNFGGNISFLGGIDTQILLDRGTPEEIEEEVKRVRNILGPRLILSPSHECLLPNVPMENIEALARAAILPDPS